MDTINAEVLRKVGVVGGVGKRMVDRVGKRVVDGVVGVGTEKL